MSFMHDELPTHRHQLVGGSVDCRDSCSVLSIATNLEARLYDHSVQLQYLQLALWGSEYLGGRLSSRGPTPVLGGSAIGGRANRIFRQIGREE